MERKGITPVVAIVLLMLVTVSGSALLYETFTATQTQAEEFEPDLDLSSDSLRVESCWNETDVDLKLSIRNEASATINASEVPFRVERQPLELGSNLSFDKDLVDPQDTFIATLTHTEEWDADTSISIITSQDTIEYRCFRLPDA